MRTLTTALVIGLGLPLALSFGACGGDDDDDDGTTTGTTTTGTTTGSTTGTTTGTTTGSGSGGSGTGGSGGSGTTDPYGPCSEPSECPVPYSECPGSSGTCAPPCTDSPDDCPDPTEGDNALQCVGNQCSITCGPTDPCPNDMTCQANIQCTW